MRKQACRSFAMKPLSLGIAAALLSACGSNDEDVRVVTSVDECLAQTNLSEESCQAAYQSALEEAARTAPRYASRAECESEFGYNQCGSSGSGSFFVPFMYGYMVSSVINSLGEASYRRRYSYNPLFRYDRPYTNYHGHLMTADGYSIGKSGRSSYRVDRSAFKPKPTVTRTVSRGGFGAQASAKSSWGGGSKSKSWGG